MLVDLLNETQRFQALAPAAVTVSATEPSNDMSACMAATACLVDIGVVSGTTPKIGFQLEESATGTTSWVILNGAVMVNGVELTSQGPCTVTTVTTSNQEIAFRALRTFEFCRLNVTTTAGTTPSFTMNAKIVAQRKFVAQSGNQGGFSNLPASSP